MKTVSMTRPGLVLAALLLAACGTPESECRAGVDRMSSRLMAAIASGEHREASGQLDAARRQLEAGDYAGCLESLEQAGALLNRGMRTNQQ